MQFVDFVDMDQKEHQYVLLIKFFI